MPPLSVIIPVHNGGKAFHCCLASITRSDQVPDEVIVVVDGSTDGSRHVAEAWGARVVRHAARQGPAHARNRGAHGARGDLLLFVDADVELHAETIGRVTAAFERDPDLEALIGSYDDDPGAENFLSQYRNLLHHYTHQTACEDASTFWGACGAIRRDVFWDVGGFDERYHRPSIEDIELGYRLTQAGYRIRLCKDIQVKHLKRWEATSLLKTDVLARGAPWTELLLRRGRLDDDLNTDVSSRLSIAATFVLGGALLAAFWHIFFLALACAALGLLITLNASFYRFLARRRGPAFALKAVPWHVFYFFYSGLSFLLGLARHLRSFLSPSNTRLGPSSSPASLH